jgi:Fur family ferric uptake transcriptional regulator
MSYHLQGNNNKNSLSLLAARQKGPRDMERKTGQKQAILKAFEQADRPLSPQEALELAKPHAKALSIATIYRNLKSLAAKGVLKAVGLPGESTVRYELHGKGHHHHFHCRCCHHVFEVDGCPGNIEPLVPRGFVLEEHEVVLYGLCSNCKKPPRKSSSSPGRPARAG